MNKKVIIILSGVILLSGLLFFATQIGGVSLFDVSLSREAQRFIDKNDDLLEYATGGYSIKRSWASKVPNSMFPGFDETINKMSISYKDVDNKYQSLTFTLGPLGKVILEQYYSIIKSELVNNVINDYFVTEKDQNNYDENNCFYVSVQPSWYRNFGASEDDIYSSKIKLDEATAETALSNPVNCVTLSGEFSDEAKYREAITKIPDLHNAINDYIGTHVNFAVHIKLTDTDETYTYAYIGEDDVSDIVKNPDESYVSVLLQFYIEAYSRYEA